MKSRWTMILVGVMLAGGLILTGCTEEAPVEAQPDETETNPQTTPNDASEQAAPINQNEGDQTMPESSTEPESSSQTEPSATEQASNTSEEKATGPALQFAATRIDGTEAHLSEYAGQVVLVVNVASKCGFTKQYDGLQALHEKYADRGLRVLGFPCNQFRGQEPGSNEDIAEFCRVNFGVTFDLFEKIDVNGPTAHPLFAHLTAAELNETGEVKWNFEKFLIDREGKVIARYRSRVTPESDELTKAIEAALGT